MQKPLIALVGPTAAGKTEIAVRLARKINIEIISCDSRQIYRGLNIGTAKPSGKWITKNGHPQFFVDSVPYHLIDVVNPDENFSAGKYKKLVEKILPGIYERNKIPLLVGGTGLYLRAVIDGLCQVPSADYRLREKLRLEAQQQGKGFLYQKLKEVDPQLAGKIKPGDSIRIIRGLEVFQKTGVPLSEWQRETCAENYKILVWGLSWERETLYERINQRVEKMVADGIIKEVKNLLSEGYFPHSNALQSLGYKEVIEYLQGEYDYARLVYLIKRNTRRYAKRQITWFRKDKRIQWIAVDGKTSTEIIEIITKRTKTFLTTNFPN